MVLYNILSVTVAFTMVFTTICGSGSLFSGIMIDWFKGGLTLALLVVSMMV